MSYSKVSKLQLASAKHGKFVWQCMLCGYWTARAGNLARHNSRHHSGSGASRRVFATLVTEASYHVPPVHIPVTFTALDTSTSSYATPSSNQRIREKAESKSSNPIDTVNADLERNIKFFENLEKLRLLLASRTMNSNPSPHLSRSHVAAFIGNICEKCGKTYIYSIPPMEDPIVCVASSYRQEHGCTTVGPPFATSENDLKICNVRKNSELAADLVDYAGLHFQDRKVVVVVKELTGMRSAPPRVIKFTPPPNHIIFTAIKAGVLVINKSEFYDFFFWIRASVGILQAKEPFRDVFHYYSIELGEQNIATDEVAVLIDRMLENLTEQMKLQMTP